jgi:hypothetical protein
MFKLTLMMIWQVINRNALLIKRETPNSPLLRSFGSLLWKCALDETHGKKSDPLERVLVVLASFVGALIKQKHRAKTCY